MIKPDEIIRSRRKTLSISIDAFARLIVRAPLKCSEERIFAFLQEKERWILRKKAEMAGAGIQLPPENPDGYAFMLLGKECQITLTSENRIRFDKEQNRLYLPSENWKKRWIAWLKTNAKRILTELTKTQAQEMGTSFVSVTITSAKSRWGACTYDNKIRYSFRLIYVPKEVIAYVVTHELAHTRYKNHSPLFWREVEKYEPRYKEKRRWLKTHGALMYVF